MNKWFYAIAAIVALGLAVSPAMSFMTVDNALVTVTGKERIVDGNGMDGTTSRYLIFTRDEAGETEVFENTDELWHFKFNSSDVYATLAEGDVCNLKVNGWRVKIFSMYRNVLSADCS